MRDKDMLYVLNELECKVTTKHEIIQFLIDEQYLTLAGSDFENEIIQDALDNLDWDHICACMKEWVEEEPESESASESESESEEEKD